MSVPDLLAQADHRNLYGQVGALAVQAGSGRHPGAPAEDSGGERSILGPVPLAEGENLPPETVRAGQREDLLQYLNHKIHGSEIVIVHDNPVVFRLPDVNSCLL